MIGSVLKSRPESFTLNKRSPYHEGLVFAGLGRSHCETQFFDSSPYFNHGTLTNMEPATDWVFDPYLGRWVLDFDGTNDYVICQPLNLTGNFTVSFWGYLRATSRNRGVVRTEDSSGSVSFVLTFQTEASTALEFLRYASTQAMFKSSNNGSATLNEWGHWVAIVNSSLTASNSAIYKNGILQTGWYNQNGIGTFRDLAGEFKIGDSEANSRYFSGNMGDLLIHNRLLSTSEILQLADPSNVMLSGLILPPTRKLWPVATTETPATFKPFWANFATQVAI